MYERIVTDLKFLKKSATPHVYLLRFTHYYLVTTTTLIRGSIYVIFCRVVQATFYPKKKNDDFNGIGWKTEIYAGVATGND